MAQSATIELPRLENESARAYAARVEYVTMGAGRSLEKLRGQSGGKAGVPNRLTTLEEWSTRYDWGDSARKYDDALASVTVQQAAEEHQKSLRAFRAKYAKSGDDLHKVASVMLSVFAQQIQGKRIEGKDGNVYVIPTMEMNANTLGQIKAALQTAADLEALALRIEDLLDDQSRSE